MNDVSDRVSDVLRATMAQFLAETFSIEVPIEKLDVLVARIGLGYSYERAGEVLGVNANTLRSRMRYVREALGWEPDGADRNYTYWKLTAMYFSWRGRSALTIGKRG